MCNNIIPIGNVDIYYSEFRIQSIYNVWGAFTLMLYKTLYTQLTRKKNRSSCFLLNIYTVLLLLITLYVCE